MGVVSRKKLELVGKKLKKRSSSSGNWKVAAGCVPIYVGEEHKLYEVPVECLSSLMLQALLIQFQEEIPATGPISLPCSLQMFDWVFTLAKAQIQQHSPSLSDHFFDLFSARPAIMSL